MNDGITCLRIILQYYGRDHCESSLNKMLAIPREGPSLQMISRLAEKIGFRTRIRTITYESWSEEMVLPCIMHWGSSGFAVLCKKGKWKDRKKKEVLSNNRGVIVFDYKELADHWLLNAVEGSCEFCKVLFLDPTAEFYANAGKEERRFGWKYVLKYFSRSRGMLAKIFVTLVLVSVIQLIYPFLAKNIFDIGIGYHSTNVVVLFLCCQVVLIFSKISLDFIRGRVLLYISTHVTLSLLSDFWIKLNRLPMIYFNTSRAGEMLQRINENEQVQSFLTGQTLNTLFSLLNFIVFSLLLVTFKASLFLIFTAGMLAYFAWMARFYKVRRELNSEIFDATSRENEATLQLIRGMEEIRLNSVHQQKRWEWEDIQRDLFRKKLKLLSITQYQQAGAIFFSQTKDVVLTFIVVRGVMKGELSFGAMLAVQYILGQLSGPAEQFVNFVQDAQRAKMAVDRLNEIHGLREEDEDVDAARSRTSFPTGMGICIRNMSFSYPNSASMPVLKNISFDIEPGKMTAIVGSSGSGKTTLLRILLKTYDRYEGSLSMGDVDFKDLRASDWRERCGAVLQDGFIFNDSIARNIAVGDDEIDEPRLIESCKVANIYSFVRSLPDNFNTRLGASGLNVSQGQRQRLLLARAAYRKPDFVFFDEPTNAMDVHNEREVVRNIRVHFRQKTIVVIAHRLSTVRNADKIIVLDDGCMIEEGTHEELTSMRGKYYDLINNQLDIIEH